VEACGQLDLAPSCRGHQRHCIRPLLHGPSAASAAIAAYRHLLCSSAGLRVEEQVVMRPPQRERLVVQGPPAPRHESSLRHSCDSKKVTYWVILHLSGTSNYLKKGMPSYI
jgi:hypothetical protein